MSTALILPVSASPTRRELLCLSGGALSLLASRPAWSRDLSKGQFTHGVASGDPLLTSVMLWTRFIPTNATAAEIRWEVAEEPDFRQPLAQGSALASPQKNYCIHAEAQGLRPGVSYYYRFLSGSGPSPTGRTRTLPQGSIDRFRLAFFSCANWEFGYMNAYAHCAAQDDIDLALHLGDYLYEYPARSYPDEAHAMPGRFTTPTTELITLEAYRQRYALYRSDPDLMAFHARLPLIATWDDHELANDAWTDGAQNHQPQTEGLWSTRRTAAIQAFLEWMPTRMRMNGPYYRRYPIGNLGDIFQLETRISGRSQQLSYQGGDLGVPLDAHDADLARAAQLFKSQALTRPNRHMLGLSQETWLSTGLMASRQRGAPWQILAQQIPLGDLKMPGTFNRLAQPRETMGNWGYNHITSRSRLGALGLPISLDSWTGYPEARARLLGTLATHAANPISLAGDTHNSWAFTLPGGADGQPSAVELCTTSVSSAGFDDMLRTDSLTVAAQQMYDCNPELQWCDLSKRGYTTLTLTPTEAQADWILLKTIREHDLTVSEQRTATIPVGLRGFAS